jgi:organic radical activating enzyme
LKSLGTFGISLTGGEPTLHPQLTDLIRKCRKLGFFRTGMISNGFFLRPELIEAVKKCLARPRHVIAANYLLKSSRYFLPQAKSLANVEAKANLL